MAFTVTKVYQDVKGSERGNMLNVTADAASDTIATGLDYITGFTWGPITMSTMGIRMRPNLTAASAACNGCIGISGCTSTDQFFLMVYGH